MNDIHPDLIERYQLALEKDPRSQVFAPLSEAYRKMGLIEEAFRISSRGVQYHPQFAGGHIALANVLMDKGQYENAKESLERAIQLSPENILAYQRLGECCLNLRLGKEALRAFKMVLLFSPTNERAKQAVQKLEALTADEYEEDVFRMDRITSLSAQDRGNSNQELEVLKPQDGLIQQQARDLERQLSLLEAYTVRGQLVEARDLAEDLKSRFPKNKTVLKRYASLTKIQEHLGGSPSPADSPQRELKREEWVRDEKLKLLQNLLRRVREAHDRKDSLV